MKKKINIAALALIMVASASAQTIYDGAKFTQKDLNGTARFVGMGGAMGALGGDISTMGTNPAGIGIYRSNDIMGTFGFSSFGSESKYEGSKFNVDKTRGSFDNIGFVFSSKIGNQTALRYVNFGFSYTRSKSFDKYMTMEGVVTATAAAKEGYKFVNWTVDGKAVSDKAEFTFKVDRTLTLKANFEKAAENPNQEDPKDDDKAVQTGDTAGSPIVPIAGLALAAGAVMAAVRKKED